MVWGTHAVRPSRPVPPCTIDVLPPQVAYCAKCDFPFVLLAGQAVPPGWSVIDGEPLCTDCAPPPKGALRVASGRMPRIDPAKHKQVGAAGSRFRGFGIGAEIVLGFAAIQIRGGASPAEEDGSAVQFMLDAEALDDFIIELGVIRAKLKASQTPGTAAREGTLS
jgi:hypothetical protein